jgi:hypothetical protein
MQNKYIKFLLVALVVAVIVPQITLAAWYNPFSWGIWNRIFHFQRTIQNPPGQQNQNQQQTPPNNQVNNNQPSINVLSPNGGEIWNTGQTYSITWKSSSLEKVDIGYVQEGHGFEFAPIAKNVQASLGVYSWKIPASILSRENKQGSFKIIIAKDSNLCGTGNCGISDYSNNDFIIFAYVSSANQTTDWKTYTNTQYDFEIQYPNSMSVQNSTNGLSLVSADNQRKINIKVESIESGQDCRKTAWAADTPNITIDNTTFVGVGSGLKDGPYYGVLYCTIHNGLDYMITSHLFHVSGGPNNFPENDTILNQILSTFKFTK